MSPERIFEQYLIESSEVCNYCFRKKAQLEEIPEYAPDFVSPRLSTTEESEAVYPPDGKSQEYLVDVDYDFKSSDNRGFGGPVGEKFRSSGSGVGRKEPITTYISKKSISCSCGVIDDEKIDGSFPVEWRDRPEDKLLEVGKRVYHRLDEQEINIDFDLFHSSLEKYKTSDEYSFGDYEVLERSVADSVTVSPDNA